MIAARRNRMFLLETESLKSVRVTRSDKEVEPFLNDFIVPLIVVYIQFISADNDVQVSAVFSTHVYCIFGIFLEHT